MVSTWSGAAVEDIVLFMTDDPIKALLFLVVLMMKMLMLVLMRMTLMFPTWSGITFDVGDEY